MAAWLLLTTTINPLEMAAGAVAAAIAATVAELVRIQDLQAIRVRPRWLLRAGVLPRLVLADTWILFRALWRHLLFRRPVKGASLALPFDPGDEDDPYAAGRRALITAAITVTPNTYVVGIDPDRNLILVHQLVPAPPSRAGQEILGRL
jgi:multisubunit Na+/H+ antiporter MnhE subunit